MLRDAPGSHRDGVEDTVMNAPQASRLPHLVTSTHPTSLLLSELFFQNSPFF